MEDAREFTSEIAKYRYPVPPSTTFMNSSVFTNVPLTIRKEGDRDEPRVRTWIDNSWVTDEQLSRRHFYGECNNIQTSFPYQFDFSAIYKCVCGVEKLVIASTYSRLQTELKNVKEKHERKMREYKEGKTMNTRESIDARIARLDAAKADLEAEQLRLELLPKEPPAAADGTNCIFFKIRFANNPTAFSYVATWIESENRWYVSGPTQRNNGGYLWDDLVNWITSQPVWEIWHVTEYGLLAQS